MSEDLDLAEFKPCQSINTMAGVTEYVFEDVACYSSPVVRGVHHAVDWMLALDDGRLVGMQFWSVHPSLSQPEKTE